MAKYAVQSKLVEGAGLAYKDWSNVPGMYTCIDKAIQTGTDTYTQAMEDKTAAEEEAKKLKEEEEAKKKAQDDAWYDVANPVYDAAGSFMKTTEYDFTFNELEDIKKELLEAQNSGDRKAEAAARIRFNNKKAEIDELKVFREDIVCQYASKP